MSVWGGKGTLLGVDTTGGSTFVTIAQRVKITGPNSSVRTVEKTHLDSTAAEYRPTIPDGGDLQLQIFYDPQDASHQALAGLVPTPKVCNWKLTYADDDTPPIVGTGKTFLGILTGFSPNGMEVDGLLGADVTVKVTGTPSV